MGDLCLIQFNFINNLIKFKAGDQKAWIRYIFSHIGYTVRPAVVNAIQNWFTPNVLEYLRNSMPMPGTVEILTSALRWV